MRGGGDILGLRSDWGTHRARLNKTQPPFLSANLGYLCSPPGSIFLRRERLKSRVMGS